MAPNGCGFNSEADPSVSLSPIHCRGLCEVWPSAGLPGGDAVGIERLAGAAGVAPPGALPVAPGRATRA